MKKKMRTVIRVIIISILAIFVVGLFGRGSISNFILKKVLFTPYNIVGFAMAIATIFGFHITRRQGHWLKVAVTVICGIASVSSFLITILGWFDIDVGQDLRNKVLEPAVINVGTVLMWSIIALVGIALFTIMVYGIVSLIRYICGKRNNKKESEFACSSAAVSCANKNKRKYRVDKIKIDHIRGVRHIESIRHNNSTLRNEQAANNLDKNKFASTSVDNEVSHKNEEKLKRIIGFEETEGNVASTLHNHKELSESDEIDISNNVCPVCGWHLIKRINKETGEQFRGCTNYGYHNCTFTISDERYLRIYWKYH